MYNYINFFFHLNVLKKGEQDGLDTLHAYCVHEIHVLVYVFVDYASDFH